MRLTQNSFKSARNAEYSERAENGDQHCRQPFVNSLGISLETGYTLVELVVVIMILGVLASLALPRFTSDNSTLLAQAQKLARDLRHTQSMAVNQGHTLVFDIQSRTSYRVTSEGSAATDPATMQPFNVSLEKGITLNGNDIGFDSMGRPVTVAGLLDAPHSITLHSASRRIVIRLIPVTGFIELSP